MAKRIYVYGLQLALKTIQHYVTKYSVQLRANMGEGAFSAIEFILGLVEMALTMMTGNENPEGDWNGALGTLSSSNITMAKSATQAFKAANGITEDW